MLARLSRTCSQLADLRWNVSSHKQDDEDAAYSSVDLLPPEVSALSQLSLSAPENALGSIAVTCGSMLSPLYQYVGMTLSEDVEKLVVTLHEADPEVSADWEDEDESEDIYVIPFPLSDAPCSSPCLPADESADAYAENRLSGCLPCAHGVGDMHESTAPQSTPICIPRIVVTPPPPQRCPEMSSRVPVQDTSFGARLTVPTHSALNASHPPMLAPSYPLASLHVTVRTWTYRQGHWCALVLGLDEQERRGIFSRPTIARRRAVMRKRVAGIRDVSISYQNVFSRKRRDP